MNTTRWHAVGSRRVRLVVACLLALVLGLAVVPAAAGTTPRVATGFSSNFNLAHGGWTVISGSWEHFNNTVFGTKGVPGDLASIARVGKFADFTYEARMKRVGCTYCANRLVVRSRLNVASGLDFAPSFFFQYTIEDDGEDGMFSVFKIKSDGTAVAVQGWTPTVAVNKWGWNTLKVEAVGKYFHFYINGTVVWEGARSGLSVGRVGISMYTDTSSVGDDFRVDWARLTVLTPLAGGSALPAPAGMVVPGGDMDRSPDA